MGHNKFLLHSLFSIVLLSLIVLIENIDHLHSYFGRRSRMDMFIYSKLKIIIIIKIKKTLLPNANKR